MLGYKNIKYLKQENLIKNNYYLCNARNFQVGKWNEKGFLYDRHKFGDIFEDIEFHYDADPRYGTVQPIFCLGEDIPIKYECEYCSNEKYKDYAYILYDNKYICLHCVAIMYFRDKMDVLGIFK